MGMGERIYLSSPHMSDEGYEMQYIKEAFDTNWIAPLGPNVDAFEREFAARVGVRSAAALSSGTAAIHMALRAAGVGWRHRLLPEPYLRCNRFPDHLSECHTCVH